MSNPITENQQQPLQAPQQPMPAAPQPQAVAAPDKGVTTYMVAGKEVKLSFQIVRNFLTKGNGNVSDQDIVQFISICRYNQLNPFLNEAYLVKYGSQPAQMVVAKEALFKRAEEHPEYDGIQAGIIIDRDGKPTEVEGSFYAKGEKLLGGWAKVYRKDRRFPFVCRVRLEEYDKVQSTWKEKPCTMIAKVAKVQALREAFPTQLGAMYTAEEVHPAEEVTATELTPEEVRASNAADAAARKEALRKSNAQAIEMP